MSSQFFANEHSHMKTWAVGQTFCPHLEILLSRIFVSKWHHNDGCYFFDWYTSTVDISFFPLWLIFSPNMMTGHAGSDVFNCMSWWNLTKPTIWIFIRNFKEPLIFQLLLGPNSAISGGVPPPIMPPMPSQQRSWG